jgi:hypothetical protein
MAKGLKEKTIYACMDEDRWESGPHSPIILDGVDVQSFKGAAKTLFSNRAEWIPKTWIVALDPGSPLFKKISSLHSDGNTETGWYEVKFVLDNGAGSNGLLQPLRALANGVPERVRVTGVEMLTNRRTQNKLNRFSRLQGAPRATKAQIKQLLDLAVADIRSPMITVYDVGQANWNALVDTHECPTSAPKVRMFFDFGVPTGWNYNTLPTPPLDPLASSTIEPGAPVVLSHWDLDHWAGAALGQPLYGSRGLRIRWDSRAVNDRKWLVPNQGRFSSGQRISPTSWRLAIILYRKGNLMVWPTLLNTVQSSRGDWLVKCVPAPGVKSNNNNTGIAFSALLHEEWRGYTLCPADAEFSSVFFNLPQSLKFFNLIASHHGGNLKHPGLIPPALYGKHSRLAISHGARYGHPTAAAKAAYTAKQWITQHETQARLPQPGLQNSGTVALPGWPRSFEKHCATCSSRIETCPVR